MCEKCNEIIKNRNKTFDIRETIKNSMLSKLREIQTIIITNDIENIETTQLSEMDDMLSLILQYRFY